MMKLYQFYIFKSVIVTSLLSVGLFVFVLLTGNAIRDVLGLLASSHLSWGTFFELILLLIPYVFTFALPLGILTGILIVLGRMSSSQEIIVLKSAGESTWSIISPVVAVALIGAAVSAQINNYQAPEAFRRYRTLLPNVFREDPLSFIEIGKPIHEFPGYVLYIRKKQGNQLEDIWIWELDKRHRAVVLVRARHGEIKYTRRQEMVLRNCEIEKIQMILNVHLRHYPSAKRMGSGFLWANYWVEFREFQNLRHSTLTNLSKNGNSTTKS